MKVGKLSCWHQLVFAEPCGFDYDGLGHCQVEHSEVFDRCMRSNPSIGQMQNTEFLLTTVNDSVGPWKITFVLCSLLQLDAFEFFFFFFLITSFLITVPPCCLYKCSLSETGSIFNLFYTHSSATPNQTLPNLTLAWRMCLFFAKSRHYCAATVEEKQDLWTWRKVDKSPL